MQKAIIHVFSGTGNSFRVARIAKKQLKNSNYEVDILRIDSKKSQVKNKYNLHLFIFPVYANAVPHIMKKYINNLENFDNVKACVIAVFGEFDKTGKIPGYEGASSLQAKNILNKKGFYVFFADAVGYPVSFTQVITAPPKKDQEEIFKDADLKVNGFLDKIIKNEKSIKEYTLMDKISSALFGSIFSNIGRIGLGKLFVADNSCISCEKCVKACPVGAIKLIKGKPRWNYKCEGCQRCINICPKKSIQTSLIRLIYSIFIFLGCLGGLIFYITRGNIFSIRSILGIFIFTASYGALSYIGDIIIFCLEKYRLFQISFTKNYTRYIEPGFRPIEEDK